MRYFKIIRDNTVIGAGTLFLRYYEQAGMFCYCGINDAQCVQDVISEKLYHPDWMLDPPSGANQPENAIVEMIDDVEYDEIVAELIDGEVIPAPDEPDIPPEPEPEPEPATEPERPMTVSEMREKIIELTALVMNESVPFTAQKDYGKGEVIINGSKVYIAEWQIVKGETVTPGFNCTETTIADVLNSIQAQENQTD